MIFLRLARRFWSVGACALVSMDWTFRRMSLSMNNSGESPELNGWDAGKTTASRNSVTDRFMHQELDLAALDTIKVDVPVNPRKRRQRCLRRASVPVA